MRHLFSPSTDETQMDPPLPHFDCRFRHPSWAMICSDVDKVPFQHGGPPFGQATSPVYQSLAHFLLHRNVCCCCRRHCCRCNIIIYGMF